MVPNMQVKNEISPTLKIIINEFDEDNRRPLDTFGSSQKVIDEVEALNNNEAEFDGDAFEDYGTSTFDHNDQTSAFVHDDRSSIVDENISGVDPTFPSYDEVFSYTSCSLGFGCNLFYYFSHYHLKISRMKFLPNRLELLFAGN